MLGPAFSRRFEDSPLTCRRCESEVHYECLRRSRCILGSSARSPNSHCITSKTSNPDIDETLQALGLERNHRIVLSIDIGYPASYSKVEILYSFVGSGLTNREIANPGSDWAGCEMIAKEQENAATPWNG